MEYMEAKMDRQIENSISENEHLSCAVEYYRAGLEQRAPKFVPSRVRLHGPVRGDFPIGHLTLAEAGDHDCDSNRYGAISVRAANGKMLGVKPAEFDVITWRENNGVKWSDQDTQRVE